MLINCASSSRFSSLISPSEHDAPNRFGSGLKSRARFGRMPRIADSNRKSQGRNEKPQMAHRFTRTIHPRITCCVRRSLRKTNTRNHDFVFYDGRQPFSALLTLIILVSLKRASGKFYFQPTWEFYSLSSLREPIQILIKAGEGNLLIFDIFATDCLRESRKMLADESSTLWS